MSDHGPNGGRVLRIDGKRVTIVADGLRLGHPGGVALTFDESALLVSSLGRGTGTAQVLMIDLASGESRTFGGGLGSRRHAGGLHRARAGTLLAWAGASRPGRVYLVRGSASRNAR